MIQVGFIASEIESSGIPIPIFAHTLWSPVRPDSELCISKPGRHLITRERIPRWLKWSCRYRRVHGRVQQRSSACLREVQRSHSCRSQSLDYSSSLHCTPLCVKRVPFQRILPVAGLTSVSSNTALVCRSESFSCFGSHCLGSSMPRPWRGRNTRSEPNKQPALSR